MATNKYMQAGRGIGNSSEQDLLHNLITESIQFLGQDLYYIPRNIPNFDELFGECPTSNFSHFAVIEMYMESFDGFDGKDDYMSKFGLRTQEEVVFRVSKRRFEEVIGSSFTRTLPNNDIRPNEGDLLYFAMDNNLFEIKNVSLKDSFYQLQNFYSYLLTCTLFQYSSEVIDTGVPEIQNAVPPSLDNLLYPSFIGSTENVLIDATVNELAIVNIGTTPLNQIDYDTSNKTLKTEGDGILNFSESNPFGL